MNNKRLRKAFVNSIEMYLETVNTPISLGMYLRVKYDAPTDFGVKPYDYLTPHSYKVDAQCEALLKKNPWVFSKRSTASELALKKFLDCESICRKSNLELPTRYKNDFYFSTIINVARQYCHRILGSVSLEDLDFGPGATHALRGKDANIVSKLSGMPECTKLAHYDVLYHILDKMPMYSISCGIVNRTKTSVELTTTKLPIVRGNCFTTVPKTVDCDRPICIEPMGNMLLQKAYGSAIRKKLSVYGLDINTGAERHRVLVSQAQKLRLSTLDLSSASDTISHEIVRLILPPNWFNSLNRLRCSETQLPDGNYIINEKFSSMGNGFTFELETLLFYCLCLAVREVHGKKDNIISVFGDDIIISRSISKNISAVLKDCGFLLNHEKSFFTGSFFESCGHDYFDGISVRPVYIKALQNDHLLDAYYIYNRFFDIIVEDGIINSDYKHILDFILKLIPKDARCYGPRYMGDICLPFIGRRIYNKCRILFRRNHRHRVPGELNLRLAYALYGLDSSGFTPRSPRYYLSYRTVRCLHVFEEYLVI